MQHGCRVLVVDDEVTSVEALGRFLSRSGYQVATATGMQEALDSDARAPADVLVTDLRLGKGHGIEVVRAIRKRRPDTPVIITTGWADDAAGLLATGPADTVLLHKPVDPLHLRDYLSIMARRP